MPYDLHLEFVMPASPARVMELLTDEKLIEEWSGDAAVFENKEGGQVSLFGGWMIGKVLNASATELAYTWLTTDWAEGTTPSTVSYKLVSEGEETRVVLEHKGLPSEEEMEGHSSGWTEHFFGPMEDYILEDDTNNYN